MGQSLLFHDKWIYNVEKLQNDFFFHVLYSPNRVGLRFYEQQKRTKYWNIIYIFFFFIIAVCRQLACANRVLK